MPVLLDPREEIFARLVATAGDENQAYNAAGFPACSVMQRQSRSRRLLQKEHVAARVQEIQIEAAKVAGITVSKVLLELAKIGFSDIRQVAKWSNGYLPVKDDQDAIMGVVVTAIPSDKISDEAAAAIAEVSQGPTGVRIKMYDKQQALLNIGRHLAMFKDRVDVDGVVQVIRQRYEEEVKEPGETLTKDAPEPETHKQRPQ